MKKSAYLVLLILLITACKNEYKAESTVIETVKKADITTSIYPVSITKVFNAHGGIDIWNKMQTLSFTMVNPNGKEVTTTNLKTRAELIDTPTYTMGYNGSELWVNEKDDNEYKGNAKFYKGLMMYFYTMPLIVGDEGVIYKDTEPLVFEGKTYPGILISYEAGVGASSDDQYIIYYDPESGQMQWLGYTVTFGKDKKSKDFHFIRYNNWQTVNGLVLPKSMDWYTYENNVPVKKRNRIEFTNISVSEKAPDARLFLIPEGAKVVE
ncbi:DUF6503 family protein [Winogradskyella sp. UBA3174]|uniref:DUF6503 family protein n=1 Tax=Winogradskyella sp. UBA3174 TaxID=1947785 RepID=UPI0025E21CA2|nr:DUF6503 family protein [Winogradskyella sp. UBA3174]|tara:strand:- start:19454 stop:20251 length:798 start_codon:yes stop_codon:yes gene_type:complete